MIGVLKAEEYYTALTRGHLLNQLYGIGQFFQAPSLFLLDNRRRHVVRMTYNQNSGEEFSLEPTNLRTEFDQSQRMIHPLGIRSDERAIVIGAKRRPVILLSQENSQWSDGRRRNADCFLVAPVYSFARDETATPYSEQFIERVKAYS